MRVISGSLCAVLVGGTAVVAGAGVARAATPYDDCVKVKVTSTTDRVTCSYTDQSTTSSLFIPHRATDVRVFGVGGRGESSAESDAPLLSNAGVDAPLGGLAGQSIRIAVGGDAHGNVGGTNASAPAAHGGNGGNLAGGGGGGASMISLPDGTPVFVAPGGGGSGEDGFKENAAHQPLGGRGGTLIAPASGGEAVNVGATFFGGHAGLDGDALSPGAGGGGGGFNNGNGEVQTANNGQDGQVSGAGGDGGFGQLPGQDPSQCGDFIGTGGGGGGGRSGGGGGGAGAQNHGNVACAAGGGGGTGSMYDWPASGGNFQNIIIAGTASSPTIQVSWTQEMAITSGDAPDAVVGQPYSFQFTSDVTGATWKVISGSTPEGTTLSTTGLLSGTPSHVASSGFTVQVTDPDLAVQRTAVVSVTVSAASPISLTSGPPAPATRGAAYSFLFTAGSCTGCSFSQVSGRLPAGITLDSHGLLSGTSLAKTGGYAFTVRATDAAGRSADFAATLQLVPATLSVNDVSVHESAAKATLTVTLNTTVAQTVRVKFATADGTAHQPGDYKKASGTLTFTSGQTTKTVSVSIVNDGKHEGAEIFTLKLSGATGAVVADNTGKVTIAASD